MYCTGCGDQLRDEGRFCPKCGRSTEPQTDRPSEGPVVGRRLVRPMNEKSIAGVCAGFARYLEVDLTLMRVVWLCAAIFTGVGFIAYLICWIVMPKDYDTATVSAATQPGPPTREAPRAEAQQS